MSLKRIYIQSHTFKKFQFFIFKDTLLDTQSANTPYVAGYKYIYKCDGGTLTIAQGNVVIQQSTTGLVSLSPFVEGGGDIVVTANGSDVTSYVIGAALDSFQNVETVAVSNTYVIQPKQYALVTEGDFVATTVGEGRGIIYQKYQNGDSGVESDVTSNIYLGNTASAPAQANLVSVVFAKNETVTITGNGVIVTFYGSNSPAFV